MAESVQQLTATEKERLRIILSDPVLWAKAFVVARNPETGKTGPWLARDYQAEILRNRSVRKVYRMGRRLGKSESMIVDALWQTCTRKNYRVLFITPYENQVELIFRRLRELIADSPMIKDEVTKMKSSPYTVEFANGSVILGFTTGASTNSGAASIRGQRADWLFLDELDYMGENDYSTVAAIANERPDIGITASSTPTGRRDVFWKMCTDPNFGYTHWHFPSQRSPLFTQELDDRARSEFSQVQYEHEILAEFGTEEMGVFNKDKLDEARTKMFYTYDELTNLQLRRLEGGPPPMSFVYRDGDRAPQNLYRTMGVDNDKTQAGTSIVVLDYDIKKQVFWVMKAHMVPQGEYSYSHAMDTIIRMNKIYDPKWIFMDKGAGEVQLEQLHLYGEQHPASGLKNKLIGWQFAQKIKVPDPVMRTYSEQPMKPFMVNSLVKAFEEDRIILSPFDDRIHKQLVDYTIERITPSGVPVYTSKNEHFVDALGLAFLAFVLKFPNIAKHIKKIESSPLIIKEASNAVLNRGEREIRSIETTKNPWGNQKQVKQIGKEPGERAGEYQQWVKGPKIVNGKIKEPSRSYRDSGAFSRSFSRGNFGGRSLW